MTGKAALLPDAYDARSLAHELGHALGMLGHTNDGRSELGTIFSGLLGVASALQPDYGVLNGGRRDSSGEGLVLVYPGAHELPAEGRRAWSDFLIPGEGTQSVLDGTVWALDGINRDLMSSPRGHRAPSPWTWGRLRTLIDELGRDIPAGLREGEGARNRGRIDVLFVEGMVYSAEGRATLEEVGRRVVFDRDLDYSEVESALLLQLRRGSTPVATRRVKYSPPSAEGGPFDFNGSLPWVDADLLSVVYAGTVVATVKRTPSNTEVLDPSISLSGSMLSVSWDVVGDDADEYLYSVWYSPDAGESWVRVSEPERALQRRVEVGGWVGGRRSRFRVVGNKDLNLAVSNDVSFPLPLPAFEVRPRGVLLGGRARPGSVVLEVEAKTPPCYGFFAEKGYHWTIDGEDLRINSEVVSLALKAGVHQVEVRVQVSGMIGAWKGEVRVSEDSRPEESES